jgi:transposase, IS30 family
MGKTSAETIAVMMAVLKRLTMPMRGSVTFDKPRQQASGSSSEGTEVSRPRRDTTFARHSLRRGLLGATTYFCDAYASWQKGGVENANGRIRRWLPRTADLDTMTQADIQEIAVTLNLTPRKCLGFRSPVEAFLAELGKHVDIRFHRHVALRA